MGTSLYDSPAGSAISSLLAQLTGGQPQDTAPPMARPTAMVQPPQQPEQTSSPSLFHRVLSNLAGLPSAIGSHLGPGMPADVQAAVQAGLLTPEQAKAAAPGFLESLAMGYGQPGYAQNKYDSNVAGILNVKNIAQALTEQKRQQQVQSDIARLFPAAPNETPEQTDNRLEQIYAYGAQNGASPEFLKAIGDVVKETVKRPKPEKGYEPKLFQDAQGGLHFIAPQDNRELPPDWKVVDTAKAGVPQLFRKPDGSLDWVLPGVTPPKGWKPEVTARTEFVQGMEQGRYNTTQTRLAYDDFTKNKDVQTLSNRALTLDKAINTISMARNATNPAQRQLLLGPALSQYIQAADQDKNLRQGLLQFYEDHMYSSIYGRFDKFLEKAKNGDLPAPLMDAMLGHLQQMREMTRQEYLNRKDDFLSTHPGFDPERLPKEGSIFNTNVMPQSDAPAGGAGDLYSKYGLKPPKP